MSALTPRINDIETDVSAIKEVPNPNLCINGSLDFWQRGTSISGINIFHADRMYAYGNDLAANRLDVDADTNVVSRWAARLTPPSSNYGGWTYTMEDTDTRQLHGHYVTFSFKMRKQGTFDGNIVLHIGYNTVEAKSAQNGNLANRSITSEVGTAWTEISITSNVVVPHTAKAFVWTIERNSMTAGGGNILDVADIKIEIGSIATPFIKYGNTRAAEFAACQRYYSKSHNVDTAPNTIGTSWVCTSGHPGNNQFFVPFKQSMRVNPTISFWNPSTGTANEYRNDSLASNGTINTTHIGDTGYTAHLLGVGAENQQVRWNWAADAEL